MNLLCMLLMLSKWKCNFWCYEEAEFESVSRVCDAILCIFLLPTFYFPYCIDDDVTIIVSISVIYWFENWFEFRCFYSHHSYSHRASIRVKNCQVTFFSYPNTTILRQTGQIDKNTGPQAAASCFTVGKFFNTPLFSAGH